MANPMPAFRNTRCDECDYDFEEGEDVYFTDDGKLCVGCACERDLVCNCGKFKKAQFDCCWECKNK